MTGKSSHPLVVRVEPARFELAPVVNRRVTYAVPKSHDGVVLTSSDPVAIAPAGIEFYTRVLYRIESEFFG
jgi:hypothetical protein